MIDFRRANSGDGWVHFMRISIPTEHGQSWNYWNLSYCIRNGWLVGGLNPSEKYESIGMIIPNIWENIKWQPKHQPVGVQSWHLQVSPFQVLGRHPLANLRYHEFWMLFAGRLNHILYFTHRYGKEKKRILNYETSPIGFPGAKDLWTPLNMR